jgi:hypothetical protein
MHAYSCHTQTRPAGDMGTATADVMGSRTPQACTSVMHLTMTADNTTRVRCGVLMLVCFDAFSAAARCQTTTAANKQRRPRALAIHNATGDSRPALVHNIKPATTNQPAHQLHNLCPHASNTIRHWGPWWLRAPSEVIKTKHVHAGPGPSGKDPMLRRFHAPKIPNPALC